MRFMARSWPVNLVPLSSSMNNATAFEPTAQKTISRRLCIGTATGTVTLGAYVSAWRKVKGAKPGTTWNHSPCSHCPSTREEILREFSFGLHDRISRHIPGFGYGRKWSSDWFFSALRTAHAANTPRLIVRPMTVPFEFRARLAQRLWNEEAA